jgi:hypothetical protein
MDEEDDIDDDEALDDIAADVEEIVAAVPAPDSARPLECPNCFKEFRTRNRFEKHVEECAQKLPELLSGLKQVFGFFCIRGAQKRLAVVFLPSII